MIFRHVTKNRRKTANQSYQEGCQDIRFHELYFIIFALIGGDTRSQVFVITRIRPATMYGQLVWARCYDDGAQEVGVDLAASTACRLVAFGKVAEVVVPNLPMQRFYERTSSSPVT